jgi:threonine dehydrogenase-like Zn-dependent dehydrogenase
MRSVAGWPRGVGVSGLQHRAIAMRAEIDTIAEVTLHEAVAWHDIMPLLANDLLRVEGSATHRLTLNEASHGYEIFQKKQNDAVKVLLQP